MSNANNVEEIKKQIQEIGQAVGESERAEKLQQRMQTQLDYIKSKVDSASMKPKSVMLVSKMNHNYGGKGSFFDDMCHFAGVKNAPAEIGVLNGQLMDKEVMLRANPDYFLLSLSWELKHDNKDGYKKEFLEDPALANLEAVKNNHVCYLKDKYLYASNQNCVWAIKKIANLAYGNIFTDEEEVFLKGY